MNHRRSLLPIAAVFLGTVALGSGTASFAQGPGGGGFGGGMQMSPAAQAKMQAFRKFSESHPNYRNLTRTLRAIGELDKDPTTKITKDEAKKMLAVVKPWTTKPVMKDADAKAVNDKLAKILNITQIKKMAALAAQQGRGGFGGGPGGGRGPGGGPGGGGPGGPGGGPGGGGRGGFGGGPGGGGPGGGGRGPGGGRNFDFSKMPDPKEYNPLNVNTYPDSPMSQRGKQRITEFLTLLQQRAA